jgi:integrase
MKAGVPHVVPLADRCLEIVRQAPRFGSVDVVFPNQSGSPLSDMAFTQVLRRMGLAGKASAHGFRSSFRDWATEVDRCREVVAEAALAHAVRDKVEAAYRRTSYLEERITLMQRWSTYCIQE